jgi:hypothetical protein
VCSTESLGLAPLQGTWCLVEDECPESVLNRAILPHGGRGGTCLLVSRPVRDPVGGAVDRAVPKGLFYRVAVIGADKTDHVCGNLLVGSVRISFALRT